MAHADAAIASLIAQVNRLRVAHEPVDVGSLAIDTAKVEFAFSKGLHSCGKFFNAVLETTCYTAKIGYDEHRGLGAFWTPGRCDGDYKVKVYRGGFFSLPNKIKGQCVGEVRVPNGAKTLNLGDGGKVQIKVKVANDKVVRFWWEEQSNTLWITV